MIRILSLVTVLLASVAMLPSGVVFAEGIDIEAGKAKAATCVACHGAEGVSPSPEWPNLAGQVPGYIATQLQEFKKGAEGNRNNAIMAGMVASLSDEDIANIDAYFSSLTPHQGFITPEQEPVALAGRSIFRAGNAEFQVPACMGCHGPSGAGVAPNFPRIAGMSKEYLQAQLLSFKNGTRSNDMMSPIAFPLSVQQIEELATYISGLN